MGKSTISMAMFYVVSMGFSEPHVGSSLGREVLGEASSKTAWRNLERLTPL